MANSKDLFRKLKSEIGSFYSPSEREAMALIILDHFGISRRDLMDGNRIDLNTEVLERVIDRLNREEPLQYILGITWFYGSKFKVNPSVLIPRPETEILVEEALKIGGHQSKRVLDLGTGSGCIAISLALNRKGWKVFASDISPSALQTAKENAWALDVDISFILHNMLEGQFPLEEPVDLLVSNPPYITLEEKTTLPKNVVGFEPHLALFAAENDPMIFYKAIAKIAKGTLRKEGHVLVEINEKYAVEVKSIFEGMGLSQIEVIKDLSGKDRIIKAYG